MARKLLLATLLLISASTAFAQSGRIKSTPEETPSKDRQRVVYVPTEIQTSPKPKPKATPTPTPKTDDDDDDVIRVESALVPIPVSVTDSAGRV